MRTITWSATRRWIETGQGVGVACQSRHVALFDRREGRTAPEVEQVVRPDFKHMTAREEQVMPRADEKFE